MQKRTFANDLTYTTHNHFLNPHRKTQEKWPGCSREGDRQAPVPHQAGEPAEE